MANLKSQFLLRCKLHGGCPNGDKMVSLEIYNENEVPLKCAHPLATLGGIGQFLAKVFLHLSYRSVQLHLRPTWALTLQRTNGHSCVAASVQVRAQVCIEITFACLCRDMPSHLSACMSPQILRWHKRSSFLRLARDRSFIHGCKFHWCSSHSRQCESIVNFQWKTAPLENVRFFLSSTGT